MGFLDWFRGAPAIDTREALVDFLDTRAAFLIQKNIFDYARARSGPYFKGMIKEPAFIEAVEVSRWTSYPVGLVAVAEVVRGIFYGSVNDKAMVDAVASATLAAFDKYPVPEVLSEAKWKEARELLTVRLSQIGLHPPKFVKDVIIPYGRLIYDAQPIHEELRKHDFEMIQNQLRINLITMHDEFDKRADKPELLHDLGVPMLETSS